MKTESAVDSWSGLWIFDVKTSPIMESVELNGQGEGKIYFLQHDLQLHGIPYLAEKVEEATLRVQRALEQHGMLNWRIDTQEGEIMVVLQTNVLCVGRQLLEEKNCIKFTRCQFQISSSASLLDLHLVDCPHPLRFGERLNPFGILAGRPHLHGNHANNLFRKHCEVASVGDGSGTTSGDEVHGRTTGSGRDEDGVAGFGEVFDYGL